MAEEKEEGFNAVEWLRKHREKKEMESEAEKREIERRYEEGKRTTQVRAKLIEEEPERTITLQVPRPEPVYFWIVDYWKQAKASNKITDIIKVEDWVSATDISQMFFNIRQRQMAEQREARELLSRSYDLTRIIVSLRNEKRRLSETLDLVKEGKEESLKGIFVDFGEGGKP